MILSAHDFCSLRPEEVFLKAGLVSSRNEARRLMAQGGLWVDDWKMTGAYRNLGVMVVCEKPIMLRRGKKQRCFITLDQDTFEVVPR